MLHNASIEGDGLLLQPLLRTKGAIFLRIIFGEFLFPVEFLRKIFTLLSWSSWCFSRSFWTSIRLNQCLLCNKDCCKSLDVQKDLEKHHEDHDNKVKIFRRNSTGKRNSPKMIRRKIAPLVRRSGCSRSPSPSIEALCNITLQSCWIAEHWR
jgi:hypothetical protein